MTPVPAPSADPQPPASGVAAWRILLRMFAGIASLFVFAFWAAAGWNTGWTKTQLAVTKTDEVTGLKYVTYQDHFAPGIELFALSLFVCVAIFAITFLRRKTR